MISGEGWRGEPQSGHRPGGRLCGGAGLHLDSSGRGTAKVGLGGGIGCYIRV